ncbi:MAG: 30S ribosomal protein S20 [Alphaproteobacteria bacterium]
MANHKSSKKSIRKTVKRTLVNKSRKTRIRTYIRKVEEAIAAGNKSLAQEALQTVQPELMIGVNKGILKLNTAARKMSRLSKKIKDMAA